MRTWNLGELDRPLSRRAALRGAGAVARPAVPGVVGGAARAGRRASPAAAAVKPPLRMGIFTVTGGTVLESWRSKKGGPLGELPSILRPLEFARDDLLLAQRPVAQRRLREPQRPRELRVPAPDRGREGRQGRRASRTSAASRSTRPRRGPSATRRSCRRWRSACRTTRPATRSARPTSRSPTRPTPGSSSTGCSAAGSRSSRTGSAARSARAAQVVRESARADSYDRSVVDAVLDEAKSLRGRVGVGRPPEARPVPRTPSARSRPGSTGSKPSC